MQNSTWIRSLTAACLIVNVAGCGSAVESFSLSSPTPADEASSAVAPGQPVNDGADLQAALSGLPEARVLAVDRDGVPTFLSGDLGRLDLRDERSSSQIDESFRVMLRSLAPAFRARPGSLVLRKLGVDEQGDLHLRFKQVENGLEVIGAELVVHVRGESIIAANGRARSDLPAASAPALSEDEGVAAAVAASIDVLQLEVSEVELAYRDVGDRLALVYRVRLEGIGSDGTPVEDDVLVDALNGSILTRLPRVHRAINRKVYNASNGSTLPGVLTRSEGQAANGNSVIDTNYKLLGDTYACFKDLFQRDSYNGGGATLTSTVNYKSGYVNAFWNSSQLVFGGGNGSTSSNLALALDVTAHEFTHAITENESKLEYIDESGGLNEAMSDILAATCEWYFDGKVVSGNTWLVGEDVWTPGTPGDALRYMNDPVKDLYSADHYADYLDGMDVHYSSGIANLAFYLLAQGGTHPRGQSSVVVTGIGFEKAARIFYKANADYLTPTSGFVSARTATQQAATALGYSATETDAVGKAWDAVGVMSQYIQDPEAQPVTRPLANALQSGVPVTNLSAPTGSALYYSLAVPAGSSKVTFAISGGTGDADLYVSSGSVPTTSSYQCRPYLNGNSETCIFNNPTGGSWYVMVRAASSFSGVKLTGTY